MVRTSTNNSESIFLPDFQLISSFPQNYGTSWIADSERQHYQFHLSEQSWNMAREYCLTLASDLVVIKSLQQMNWLISHYPPSNSIICERTVQIGLVLIDKENSTEKEWKWVDNTSLNATYLEWEMLTINTTEKDLNSTERDRCALLNIDNRILKAVPCDQTPDFDYTNRFICQRNDEQHLEHEKKNNPLYEFFVQLINKRRRDEAIKLEPRIIQLQGVKTEIAHVQRKTEDLLPPINEKEENITDENKEDRLSKIQKITTKRTLTTANPDVEGTDEVDYTIEQKGKSEDKKHKIANENKHENQAKNFIAKGKLVESTEMQQENTEKDEDVPLVDRTEIGFKRNVTNSSNSANLSKQNSQQSNKLCDENDTEQKDSRTWYEQFGDIFRNLNLFLKQEKSSDLRALLDNNDTSKTLVERLKETLHAKNNTQIDITEKKKILQKEIDDQQQFNDSMPEEPDVSNILAREIVDDIKDIFLHKKHTAIAFQKAEGGSAVTGRIYDTMKLAKAKIYGKIKSAERSEANDNGIYGQFKKKLKNMLTRCLRNLFNLDSDATNKRKIREDIMLKTSEEQINRNETAVHYDPINEQNPGLSSMLSANQMNNVTEETTDILHTSINNIKQTTESNNEPETALELSDCNTKLLKEYEADGNKINTKTDVEKAIPNMKQNLESTSEEIERLFSHSWKQL
ncbi:unnamed protein product [Onchocerca flexuosa]|uniref:Lectin C-type domain protein n=1 Tax=Onchocerca flexuosa TaxID=387005 RepID=A0A183H0H9_9BILA|nr:unnamed protein product [Onchocerca flexuosa]